ncbi:glycerol-3-phosphate responsive antiterminator GlpP [Gracilibacillus salitolerans]|uniref:Glycerol uptake operon antiterminator regulatory protein n=1 Tax=Gracilibacillus salitolerans TaxID=2663022 RepID=A0A5Q2TIY2_9BACI|nr:glycerol-3-phosphate responsive antiterminator [Gracilibacillus salitolerans]QGH33920.1 glycerol-3-phosphate responsive antiterminator GlpP [Gracilibacillus salitolerans]
MKLEGVLPAVRKMKDFDFILKSDHELFIILETRIAQLQQIAQYARKFNKKILVHADLINGLKVDQYGMEFLVRHVKVDGIISTRANVISLAKKSDIVAIQRLFAIDSSAIEKNIELIEKTKPDYIEVLPGIIPSVISDIVQRTGIPVIAGGLIKKDEDIQNALQNGAVAITTSNKELF